MFAKFHPETDCKLDDKCFMLESGELLALTESILYVLDSDQSELKSYPITTSSKLPKLKKPQTAVGIAGSDIYKTLPVDPAQLYSTYDEAVSTVVKGRREKPNVDLGILIYFPQKSNCKPSYMVSTYYNGGIWRDTKHCFTERISDTLVALPTVRSRIDWTRR